MPEIKALYFCSQGGFFLTQYPPETEGESVQAQPYSLSYNSGNPRMSVAWIRLNLPRHQGGHCISNMFTGTEIVWLQHCSALHQRMCFGV